MGGNELLVILKLKDELTTALKNAGGEVNKSKASFGGLGDVLKTMGTATVAVGAAAGGALVSGLGAATLKATNFETLMGNVSTLISGDATEAVKQLKDGVLGLASAVPQSPEELGTEAYNIMSAGFSDASTALDVLQNSSFLATAGLGSLAGSTDIMTSSMNAFKSQGLNASQTADILFKTTKYGKTTVEQMSQAFGATAPVIASAGISLQEFSAATAALTTTGLPASQAQNQLRAATTALMAPTDDMNKLLKQAGFESGEAALKNVGLVDTMKSVSDAAGGSQDVLKKAYGSVEALGAATSLTGQTSEAFNTALKDMEGGSNAVTEAFIKQKKTVANQWNIIKNQLNVALIEIGDKVLPLVSRALGELEGFWEENRKTIMDFVNSGLAVLGQVAQDVFNNIGKVINFLKPMVLGLFEYFKTTAPIVLAALVQAWNYLAPALMEFWNALVRLWNSLQPLLPILQFLTGVIFVALVIAVKIVIEIFTILANIITWLMNDVLVPFANWLMGVLIPVWNAVYGFISTYVIPIFQSIIDIGTQVMNFFSIIFAPTMQIFLGIWKVIWLEVKTIFGLVWDTIVVVATIAWNAIKNVFLIGMEYIKGVFKVGSQILHGDFSGAMETIKNTASHIMGLVKDTFSGAVDAIVGYFSGIGSRIGGALSNLGGIIKSAVKGAIKAIPGVGGEIAQALGFARGGSFVVGGTGGTDSQPISFMATPGERVTVETPQQQASSDNRNYSKSVSIGQVVVNNNQDYQVFLNKLALLI
jgi:TP901 family phage tail tape measure protein